MKQIGYRPFHATKRLNNGLEEEDDERSDEPLRSFVFEILQGVYYLGMKRCTLPDIFNNHPGFYGYLSKNFAEQLQNCRCFVQRHNGTLKPTPYVMLPDENMTVVSWDGKSPKFHSSEDLKRSLEKI